MIWLLIDSRTVGGIERHVANLARALDSRGFATKIALYADYGPGPWLDQLELAGLPYIVLRGNFAALIGALATARPQLVHTHGYKAGILGRIVCRMLAIPVISSFHSGERPKYPVSLYRFADTWTSFLGGRIAVTAPIGAGIPFRTPVIPNFVPIAPVAEDTSLPRRVGFVGRLSHEKAPDLFCELARRMPLGLEWHVYGDGPMRSSLERRYGDHVRFHGLVTDLGPIWPMLGLLVMPSRHEGLPLAALEALSYGVPVLASRVGGLPTILANAQSGWLFTPDDLADASEKVTVWHLLDYARQCALRKACRRHVAMRFSEDAILPQILDTYKRTGYGPIGLADALVPNEASP